MQHSPKSKLDTKQIDSGASGSKLRKEGEAPRSARTLRPTSTLGFAYGAAFRFSMGVPGESGVEAQTGELACHWLCLDQGGDSCRGGTPADQGLLTGQTAVGYAEKESRRHLVFSIVVRDVPISSPQDILAIDEDEGALAAATQ